MYPSDMVALGDTPRVVDVGVALVRCSILDRCNVVGTDVVDVTLVSNVDLFRFRAFLSEREISIIRMTPSFRSELRK